MRGQASRTAVLTCQGRAVADDRLGVGRFSDPVAVELLREEERLVVEQVRREEVPPGFGPRMDYEFMRRLGAVMTPRTIAIDDAVRESIRLRPGTQVVILGAGLDARAWRMEELADAVVFEVDHPASQTDKQDRLGARQPLAAEVRFVATDFVRTGLVEALDAAGHRPDLPTTWIWEGVVVYLTEEQVRATLEVVGARSSGGARLVVNYQAPSTRAVLGKLLAQVLMRVSGRRDVWRDEPHRSRWSAERIGALVGEHGFCVVSDQDLQQIADSLGLVDLLGAAGGSAGGSLEDGRVLVADRLP